MQMYLDEADKIRHVQASEGDITMEVFYMLSEAGEKELFRIYFGAADMGEYIGRLQTDSFNVPVSVASPPYSREDFADEAAYSSYCALMEQLDVLLSSVRENENFRVDEVVPQETSPSVRKEQIGDWLVELPESIQWNLVTSETGYHIDFTMEMGGENLQLYTIYIGEAGGSVVGLYNMAGNRQVEHYAAVRDQVFYRRQVVHLQ